MGSFFMIGGKKFLSCDTRLAHGIFKRSNGKGLVLWNHTALVIFPQDNMASFLPGDVKPEFSEYPDCIIA